MLNILRYPNLPCLDLGKQNYTPMELCTTELTNLKKLDPRQTSDMIKATAVPCGERKKEIENMIRNSGLSDDPILKSYNISIQFQMTQVMGRVLQPPELEYGNNILVPSKKIGTTGRWDNMNKKFCSPKELGNWILVNFSRRLDNQTVDNVIYGLQNAGRTHGLRIPDPILVEDGDNRLNGAKALDYFLNLSKNNKNLQFIFAILPGTSQIYSKY